MHRPTLWLYTVGGKARFNEGPRIAQELLDLAERQGDPALLLEARHALSPPTLWVGEPAAARQHAEQGIALYDQERHRSLAFLYGGHDPGDCCHMHSALALWMLGYPRAALDRGRRGMTLARDLAHPLSIANALPFLGAVQQLRGEVEEVHELADSTMELSAAHGLPQWLAIGRMLSGWVQAERGHGVAQLQSALDDYRSKGKFDFWESYFLTLLAAAFLKHGAIDDGLRTVIEKALPLMNDGWAIIVITSIAENKGIPGFTAYSATKAAVRSFVRTWTAELKDRRIRVNAISPGPIDTPIFDQQAPTKEGADQARAQFAAAVPFGRLGRPDEIASTALFLASDEASFIAGVDLPVDGGMTAI
jgi:hypothetical protein